MKFSRSIIKLLVLFVLFSLLFFLSYGLVLLTGIKLSIINVPTNFFNKRQESSLAINAIPHGSKISINGKVVGESPLHIFIDPGKYQIEIKRDGFFPYEETIVLQPMQQYVIEYHLRVNPLILNVSGNATNPLWVEGNSFFYFDLTNQKIARHLPDGTNIKINELQGIVTSMSYCNSAQIFVGYISYTNPGIAVQNVVAIDTTLNEEFYLGIGEVTSTPLSDHCNVYLLGWYEDSNTDDFSFWMGSPNETLQQKDLSTISEFLPPEAITLSADENWLIIESGNAINLWKYDGNTFIFETSISHAHGAAWSPIETSFVYMDQDGTMRLNRLSDHSNEIIFSSSALLPIRWMPNGKQIVFTTYNPANGGSSFWAVDVDNGVRILLADSSLILGRVTDFAISPDGTRIAYTNDLNHLNILFIGD